MLYTSILTYYNYLKKGAEHQKICRYMLSYQNKGAAHRNITRCFEILYAIIKLKARKTGCFTGFFYLFFSLLNYKNLPYHILIRGKLKNVQS